MEKTLAVMVALSHDSEKHVEECVCLKLILILLVKY